MNPTRKVQRTVRPGTRGTLRHMRRWGDALIAVRYGFDATRELRYTTVELIVDARRWSPGVRRGQ